MEVIFSSEKKTEIRGGVCKVLSGRLIFRVWPLTGLTVAVAK